MNAPQQQPSQEKSRSRTALGTIRRLAILPLEALIVFYRYAISPLFPPTCRYTPTCSQYALEALRKYGLIKGSWLTIKRLMRCHPWGGHGHDPLP